MRRAGILSWINVLKSTYHVDDSHLMFSLDVVGDSTESEWFDYPEVDRQMVEELISAFSQQGDYEEELRGKNFTVIDSIFRRQLDYAGLYPRKAFILPPDSIPHDRAGLWEINFSINNGTMHLYNVYISSMGSEVLLRMAGIIATSAAILLLMGFLIWYLLHWVERLRTIEQMKDDFTHNMTHELKTPVAVAYSAADSMLRYYDQSDEARNRQFLTIILQRLSHLSGMIENILSMSMERFKTMRLNIEPVAIRPLAEDVAGMIRLKTDKSATIEIDMHDSLHVMADAMHLGNVLSNLIENAVKYSGESVVIRVHAEMSAITVEDNGVGIDKDCLPYIFDKFYRAASGDRYDAPGYGLGLYYVKQIVDLHGWDIEVESKKGRGTKFTIKINGDEKR